MAVKDSVTSVNDVAENIKGFHLLQNYTNPFNPNTKIFFSIPKGSFTQLKVYDIFGREIKTLVKEYLQAGTHSREFNGNNIASRVYFNKLKSGNYTSIKKMMFIK